MNKQLCRDDLISKIIILAVYKFKILKISLKKKQTQAFIQRDEN